MSLIVTDSQNYTDIADSIRGQINNNSITFKPNEMAAAIDGLTVSGIHSWMGIDAELVSQPYTLSTTLDKTGYNGWTPSTTAKSIQATQSLTAVTIDLANYDYFILWLSDCVVAYDNTWSISAASCMRLTGIASQCVFRRPAAVTTMEESNFNYNVIQTNLTSNICKYYNTTPALVVTNTTYSPCYMSIGTPTVSSTSSASPKLTIKTPVLNARCQATYFSTANAAKVDQANTTVKMNGYLYRVKIGTSPLREQWTKLVDIYNNPL